MLVLVLESQVETKPSMLSNVVQVLISAVCSALCVLAVMFALMFGSSQSDPTPCVPPDFGPAPDNQLFLDAPPMSPEEMANLPEFLWEVNVTALRHKDGTVEYCIGNDTSGSFDPDGFGNHSYEEAAIALLDFSAPCIPPLELVPVPGAVTPDEDTPASCPCGPGCECEGCPCDACPCKNKDIRVVPLNFYPCLTPEDIFPTQTEEK